MSKIKMGYLNKMVSKPHDFLSKVDKKETI